MDQRLQTVGKLVVLFLSLNTVHKSVIDSRLIFLFLQQNKWKFGGDWGGSKMCNQRE